MAIRVFRGHERQAAPLIEDIARFQGECDIATGVHYRPRGRRRNTRRRVTVKAGGSGHFRITAGTLGGFVEDDDRYYILSNHHVLADSDAASVGDPILWPGPDDIVSGGYYAVVERLDRWVPLRRSGSFDAAVARFGPDVNDFYPWDYPGIGEMVPRPIRSRHSVTRVVKRGRTTGTTTASIRPGRRPHARAGGREGVRLCMKTAPPSAPTPRPAAL